MGKQETLKRKEIRVTEKKVNGKVILALISGAIATGVMSIVMELETFIGLPEINTAAMLSEIMSTTLAVGWLVHFAVGIFFSYAYILLINSRLPIKNSILRGITYGLLVICPDNDNDNRNGWAYDSTIIRQINPSYNRQFIRTFSLWSFFRHFSQ